MNNSPNKRTNPKSPKTPRNTKRTKLTLNEGNMEPQSLMLPEVNLAEMESSLKASIDPFRTDDPDLFIDSQRLLRPPRLGTGLPVSKSSLPGPSNAKTNPARKRHAMKSISDDEDDQDEEQMELEGEDYDPNALPMLVDISGCISSDPGKMSAAVVNAVLAQLNTTGLLTTSSVKYDPVTGHISFRYLGPQATAQQPTAPTTEPPNPAPTQTPAAPPAQVDPSSSVKPPPNNTVTSKKCCIPSKTGGLPLCFTVDRSKVNDAAWASAKTAAYMVLGKKPKFLECSMAYNFEQAVFQ